MINIIFRNNTMIRILAIELLNRILILIILMINLSLKTDGVPWQFYRLVQCAVSWKGLEIAGLEERIESSKPWC
jgi:hypothetical protein